MQYQLSSKTPYSMDAHPYFAFSSRSRHSSLNYFNTSQVKQSALYREDFSDDAHLTECLSPSELNSLDNFGGLPYYQNFNDTKRFGDNFDLGLDISSGESFPQVQTLEELRQKPVEELESYCIDQFFCLSQESGSEIQQNYQDCFFNSVYVKQSEETNNVTSSNPRVKGWSEEDEIILKNLAVKLKFDWKKIAKKFDNKKFSPYFLKRKYKGYNESVPKRVKFSHEEDVLLAQCFKDYGIDWEKIATNFQNRTSVMLKNRFYSYLRKENRLETLLKETKTIEENDIEQNISQFEGTPDFSVMTNESDNESQLQSELLTDAVSEKSERKSSERDEIARLKAQLKSFKSLYVATSRELRKFKAHQ